jgi:hypothetical protein
MDADRISEERIKPLGREVEVDVLLTWDGEAVASGGIVAPVLNNRDYTFIHAVAESAEEASGNDVPFFINRDFDDDIAFESWRTNGASDDWIWIDDRVGWANFVSVCVSVSEGSVAGAGRSVAGWGESAGHRRGGSLFGFRGASLRNVKMCALDVIDVGGFANFLGSAVFQVHGSVTGAAHSVKRGFGFDVVRQGLPDEECEDHHMNRD